MALDLDETKDKYFSDQYKNIIRSCQEYLIEHSEVLPVTNLAQQYAHKNDFHKYLRVIGIKEELVWATSFINGIIDPHKNFFPMREIRTIKIEFINNITKTLNTRYEN